MHSTQKTIQNVIEFRGKGLHSGKETILRLFPSAPNTGISFVRTDVEGSPIVFADVGAVREIQRRTALVNGRAEIHTVEHLMAPLYACSITNLRIEVEGEEIPGLDGSALVFYQEIQKVGICEQFVPVSSFELKESVSVVEQNSQVSLEAHPFREGLKLTYFLSYEHPSIGEQEFTVLLTEETFAQEIAPARTFVLEREVELLKKAGLGQGATYENTLVFGDQGVIQNSLRFPNECVRHKILDLLGDISLLNVRLKAHLVAKRSGHQTNLKLGLKLKELIQNNQTALKNHSISSV